MKSPRVESSTLPVALVSLVARIALVAAVALATAGCHMMRVPTPKPVNWYLGDAKDVSMVRRIMLLPFQQAAGVEAETELIREAFIAELAKIQRFEVVALPRNTDENEEIYRSVNRGRISAEAMVALATRYKLDGIMIGTVTSYRAYLPPHLGLRAKLFSVHSGSYVWGADGLYDAADSRTMDDLEHYQHSFLAEEASMHGVRMNLLSPHRFASYVSHRLIGTWRKQR